MNKYDLVRYNCVLLFAACSACSAGDRTQLQDELVPEVSSGPDAQSGELFNAEQSKVLATVEKGDAYIDFVEVNRGIVVLQHRTLREDANKSAFMSALDGLAETSTTEERYLMLAGENVDPAALGRIQASDVRLNELMMKYETGELAMPPREGPATTPLHTELPPLESHANRSSMSRNGPASSDSTCAPHETVEKGFTCFGANCEHHEDYNHSGPLASEDEGDFFGFWCPTGQFDDTWCLTSTQGGTWHSGWQAPTKFFRTVTANYNSCQLASWDALVLLDIWDNGSWRPVTNRRLWRGWWINYYSWHRFSRVRVMVGGHSHGNIYQAAVWNFL